MDDQPAIRSTFRNALECRSWEVMEAESGEAALEILGREPFDLIFLDLLIPEMDGFEVLRALRSDGNGTPVVLVSGFRLDLTEEEAKAAGSVGFLPKPTSPEQLRIVASRFLEGSIEAAI